MRNFQMTVNAFSDQEFTPFLPPIILLIIICQTNQRLGISDQFFQGKLCFRSLRDLEEGID